MNILLALRAELLKTRRTASLYVTLLAAAFVPLVFYFEYATETKLDVDLKTDALNVHLADGFEVLNVAILPMFVILVSTLLAQIEFRSNAWKQVLAAPQPLVQVYAAKFLLLQLFIVLFLVCFNGLMFATLLLLNLQFPEINLFANILNVPAWLRSNAVSYVLVLALGAFQFGLSMRLRNFIAPIAIGFVGWIGAGMMVFEAKLGFADLFPFAYPMLGIHQGYQQRTWEIAGYSLAYAALFLVVGYWVFRRRGGKG